MAPTRIYGAWAGRSLQWISCEQSRSRTLQTRDPLLRFNSAQCTRRHATKSSPPLVHVRPSVAAPPPPLQPSSTHSARSTSPSAYPGKTTVYAPYLRITLGIILCGSLIYSMVASLPVSLITFTHQSLRPLVDEHPNKTTRAPHHRRPRLPHKARIWRRSRFSHAPANGILHPEPAEGNCPDP